MSNVSILTFQHYSLFLFLLYIISIIIAIKITKNKIIRIIAAGILTILFIVGLKLTFNFADEKEIVKQNSKITETYMFERSEQAGQRDNSLTVEDNIDKYNQNISKEINKEQEKIHRSIDK